MIASLPGQVHTAATVIWLGKGTRKKLGKNWEKVWSFAWAFAYKCHELTKTGQFQSYIHSGRYD